MNMLFAQPSKRFEHLSLEHGLPQSSALALLQDHKGFLWVGTQEGLARYDGYNFTVYRKHPYQIGVLKGDWVQTLHEDKEGMLWIGTLDGGIQQFNPFTQRFTAYPYKLPENLQATAAVRSISEDSASQSLWLGTNGSGIVVFDKKTQSFSQAYRADKNNTHSLPSNAIRDFYRDKQGKLWIGTSGGLCVFDPKMKTFETICPSNAKQKHSTALNITTLCAIAPDALLIGTANGDILRFDCINRDL